MSHTLDKGRLGEVFEGIEAAEDRLTAWERSFVESVREQWERSGSLSERQLEILEGIWNKV